MKPLHSLLKRQLRRFSGETIALIEDRFDFLKVINEAYWQFDADRTMLERSLELTSQELLEKNAELSHVNAGLEIRVADRTAELASNEARFRGLFEHVPVSIWEEDFSSVREYIDRLRWRGVQDFSTYFNAHPEAVAESAALVKIVDVNHATLEMYEAESKAQLLSDLSKVLGPESLGQFREELLALIRGDPMFETELVNYTLRGEKLSVFLRLTIAPGYEQTWAKVFVGISDVTERRKAEAALAAERDLLQALMENIPDTIYFKDTSSRFTRINLAQTRVLGISSAEEAIGKTDLDFQNTDLARSFYEEEQRLVQTGEPLINRIEFNPTSDGQARWFSATKVPIKNEVGHVTGLVGISHDITSRKKAEEALRQSEERFKLVAWATKDAVWDWDMQTDLIWWGDGLKKIFHYSAEMIQTSAGWRFDHIHPDDQARVRSTVDRALESGMEFWSKEYRFQRKDGTYVDIMDRGYILRDDSGQPYRMIGAMMDMTERKAAEMALQEANSKMTRSLNELQNRNREIALLNKIGHSLQACQSAEEAYQIIADLAHQLFPDTAGAIYLPNPARTLVSAVTSWGDLPSSERTFTPGACCAWHRDQTRPLAEDQGRLSCLHLSESRPAVSHCLPMQAQGEILGVLHIRTQHPAAMDEAKLQLAYAVVEQSAMVLSNLKLREELREQSIRDPLTGLYNRRYMEETLKQHLRRVGSHWRPLGILMIDIDHFKRFNDTYGHATGDLLLKGLSQFLQTHIRHEDIVCRYGGEEFLVIMPDATLEVAQQRAEYLRQQITRLRIQDAGHSHQGITLSVGVASYPQQGRTKETILRAADTALYRAKQQGRNCVVVAESTIENSTLQPVEYLSVRN